MVCGRFTEGLEALAQGGRSPSATAHVAVCAECAWRLTQMRRLVDQLREPQTEALRTRLVARLIGDGRGRAGARRGENAEFALHVGVDGFALHLAYSPVGAAWEVLGRAPDAAWSVVHGDKEMACGPSGRFRLAAATLAETSFTLRSAEMEVDVPSAREMIDLGT